jgi:hypothetical protein
MIAGVVAPDVFRLTVQSKEIAFFSCMAAAFICVILGAGKEIRAEASEERYSGHVRRMISIYGIAKLRAWIYSLYGYIFLAG